MERERETIGSLMEDYTWCKQQNTNRKKERKNTGKVRTINKYLVGSDIVRKTPLILRI